MKKKQLLAILIVSIVILAGCGNKLDTNQSLGPAIEATTVQSDVSANPNIEEPSATTGSFLISRHNSTTGSDSFLLVDSFPSIPGTDFDFWADNGAAFASETLYVGQVGAEAKELGAMRIDEIGVTVCFCVPEMPTAIKDYATRNGFNIIKMYLRTDGANGGFSYLDSACSMVFLYKDWIKLNMRHYPSMQNPNDRWSVSFEPALQLPEDYLPRKDKVQITFSNFMLDYSIYRSTGNSFSLTADYDVSGVTLYGGNPNYALAEDESITYTDTALLMSDKEAQWFVDYLSQKGAQ